MGRSGSTRRKTVAIINLVCLAKTADELNLSIFFHPMLFHQPRCWGQLLSGGDWRVLTKHHPCVYTVTHE